MIGGGLKAVYCNDEHLIVHSNGVPFHTDGLAYIPRPPGEGGVDYSSASVTRSYHQSLTTFKVPLDPVMLSTSAASNNLDALSGRTNPASYAGETLQLYLTLE